ncbi:putative nicotinate-nucleotide adenylyltransferase [Bryobacterales bacterium F-183]|nr:putative nicotinate-nucleotide adenylyltransferase [Bryobacterales bacterium F-183]
MKIAIFGGTFDPIHNAHLAVALEAARHCMLDRVLMIPAGNPPHKNNVARTPYPHRYRMVELACEPHAQLLPSRLEEGSHTTYSIDTIERIPLAYDDELYFIIGADAFAEIGTWKRWREVLEKVVFIVVSRPGHEYAVPEGASVLRLDHLALDVSSTAIRNSIEQGEKPEGLPTAVWKYIEEHNLYR